MASSRKRPNIELFDAHDFPKVLYELLSERKTNEGISHKKMPSLDEHYKFVKSRPYKIWKIIICKNTDKCVGCVYLTNTNEIGVSIFKKHRRKGYAEEAMKVLITTVGHDVIYANINPKNKKSQAMVEKLGFKHIQNTYKLG